MTILQHSIAQAAAGSTSYQIARSLRFNSADSAYLNRTPASAGSRKTMTLSIWLKRTAFGTQTHIFSAGTSGASNCDWLEFQADNTLRLGSYNGAFNFQYVTSQVFRDPSAFLHINVAIDTTNATSTDRIKISINGSRVTAFSTSSAPSLNADCPFFNTAVAHYIGKLVDQSVFINAYKADIRFIDGQALDPTSFGETDSATGVWVPKAYTGTYGTNGFWLKFDDNSGVTATTLGKDSSGNGNNWTPNNFSVTAGVGNDSLVDSPTNYGTDTGVGGEVRGNYATLNPLDVGSGVTLSNGGLTIVGNANNRETYGTLAVSSGKWYFEATMTTATTNNDPTICIAKTSITRSSTGLTTPDAYGLYLYGGNAFIQKANNNVNTNTNATKAVDGDVIGIAFDLDAGKIWAHKNGTWMDSGSPTAGTNPLFSGLSGTFTPGGRCGGGSTTNSQTDFNFGQRPFAYTAPSGFKALCTTNLPTPAIGASASTLANKYFDINLWTGTGASQNIVNAGGFAPDFVWTKPRNAAVGHTLFDTIRGVTKYLQSNTTGAEGTSATSLTAFNSNGFTVNSDTSTGANGSTYVGWQWKAGGAAVSNTAGSITSQVSANAAAGISVLTYTGNGTSGATIGHGLGVTPAFIIIKKRGATGNWQCWHKVFTGTQYITLNLTNGVTTLSSVYNAAPSSTVFQLGNDADVNASGATYVALCFAEIAGFSKFGSYTGNGSADGPFVFTGMRSRWVLIKRTDAAGDNWFLYDTARNTYNVADLRLYPNTSGAEASGINAMDILSNGFKLRTTDTSFNASGGTYIFAAFAESPFNYSRAR